MHTRGHDHDHRTAATDALLAATTQLYRSLYPTLFRLATDLHPVSRELFTRLVGQLTVWFTKARRLVLVRQMLCRACCGGGQRSERVHARRRRPAIPHSEHPETEALLDALTEGLGKAESGPVRALCASFLARFLEFAVRQTSRTQMGRSPVVAEALLTRLERLARHPNRYRRLGGAMALLQALTFLRREVRRCCDD